MGASYQYPLLDPIEKRSSCHGDDDVEYGCSLCCGVDRDMGVAQPSTSSTPSSSFSSIAGWFQAKLVQPFCEILKSDVGPKKLAISAALGVTLGVFPVCGVTFILCAVLGVTLSSYCHVPTLLLASFVSTPLEIGLIVPFLRVGEWIFGGKHFLFTAKSLWMIITGQASSDVFSGLLHALTGWAILAPLLLGFFYLIFLPLFWYLHKKYGSDLEAEILINDSSGG